MLRKQWLVAALGFVAISAAWAQTPAGGIEVVDPSSGQKYLLLVDGTWKKLAMPANTQDKETSNRANRAPQPQGGLFGLGRDIMPGDPEYNRGSMNPKMR